MPLFNTAERAFAAAVSRAVYSNPFLPERIACERQALGAEFVEAGCDWNARPDSRGAHANIARLTGRAGALAEAARQRLADGARPAEADLRLYEDLVLFFLYHQFFDRFTGVIDQAMRRHPARHPGRPAAGADPAAAAPLKVPFYRAFAALAERFLRLPGVRLPGGEPVPHLFACFFQVRRAFHHIFRNIVGGSAPACRLRAAAWESIFTRDLRRYRRALFRRMGDLTTLITGPSGTGKELVARAIALSRYIPFDPDARAFTEDFAGSFHALNLSALSPTLIESELFGHRRGSFTGALDDRAGWLEVCPPLGAVFLDEVGEIEPPVQVKLLRVLQTREFQRLGDTRPREFRGKIIAATHRDLRREIRAGRFREDFYYRLCSDQITTPPLCELLAGSEGELHDLVLFIARRVVGAGAGGGAAHEHGAPPAAGRGDGAAAPAAHDAAPDDDDAPPGAEARALAGEVERWIARNLGRAYPWPGNFRELEQCVRNVLVRGTYRPVGPVGAAGDGDGADDDLSRALDACTLSADDLVRRYVARTYARTRSYEETARLLALDRRTVKSRLSPPKPS